MSAEIEHQDPLRSPLSSPQSLVQDTRSRRNRTVRQIVGITVVIAGLCAYYSYQAIRRFTLEKVKKSALLEVQQGVDDIDKWLATLKARIETLAHTPAIQTLEWSTVEPYLQLELARQTNLFKFTLIGADGYRIANTSVGLKRNDLNDRVYFQKAIVGQTYPSDAIVSRTTGFVQINIATPIWSMPLQVDATSSSLFSENREPQSVSLKQPIGVFSGSVKIDRLAEVIQQLNYCQGSYGFILNSEGQAMVHPDPALVSTRENPAPSLVRSPEVDLAAVARRMIQKQRGIDLVRLDDRMHYIAYLPLEEADWSIGLVIPRSIIERKLRPLNAIALIVATLTGIIIFVLWRVRIMEETHLRQSKADAEAIANAASAANRAKSEFLSQIGHELRTPLNSILGYAQLLKRDRHLGQRQLKGLDIIHQSGDHLLMLINDILDLSKIEARKLELVPTTIHLPDFLNHVSAIVQMRALEKDIVFNYDADPNLPVQIEVDETRLRQILLNLLGNAVKFTDTGSVTLSVQILAKHNTTATLRFEISDTGVGIRSQNLVSIFDPFEQVTEGKPHREGMGLGLAIARQLVEKMGGMLQVESEWNRGSRFWFEATFSVISLETGAVDAEPAQIIGYLGVRRTILVVDDRADNCLVLQNLLEPLGFDVVLAQDGQQAIDLALEARPDLILMDLIMPQKSGFETMEEMRQYPQLQSIPTIAISASVGAIDRANSLRAGCDAFLPKPIQVSNLLVLFKHYLDLQWQYDDLQVPNGMISNRIEELGSHKNGKTISQFTLILPPLEELTMLYELAQFGNMQNIWDYASYIEGLDRRYQRFSRKIQDLAEQFEDEEIIKLVELSFDRLSSNIEKIKS